jgi:hypothetical protein
VFLITAGVYLIGAVVLILFTEAKTQDFAMPKKDNSIDTKNEKEFIPTDASVKFKDGDVLTKF